MPVLQGLGNPDILDPPGSTTFNDKFYCCTGKGSPRIYNGESEMRMGIVTPSYAPTGTVVSDLLWSNVAYTYGGAPTGRDKPQEQPSEQKSVRFTGNQRFLIPHKDALPTDLQGSRGRVGDDGGTTADYYNPGDGGIWEMIFQPSRLDRKMVLLGKTSIIILGTTP